MSVCACICVCEYLGVCEYSGVRAYMYVRAYECESLGVYTHVLVQNCVCVLTRVDSML